MASGYVIDMSYLGSGDPARQRTDYYPAWLDDLAEDVTLEAAVLDGIVTGRDDVRMLLAYARTLYDYQDFDYVGPSPQVDRLVMTHRPLSAVLLFSRLMGEHFRDTAYGKMFFSDDAAL